MTNCPASDGMGPREVPVSRNATSSSSTSAPSRDGSPFPRPSPIAPDGPPESSQFTAAPSIPCTDSLGPITPEKLVPQTTATDNFKLSWFERLTTSWVLEVLGLVVSAGSLAAMVGILKRFDRQLPPSWGAVSFNAVIAVLATTSKMTALFGCTSAVSQLKWTWFSERERRLDDFYVFDSGSRGLGGATSLIWFLKFRQMAALGAVAIILGAGADPFAQQLVHYYQAGIADSSQSAWVSRAVNVTIDTVEGSETGLRELSKFMFVLDILTNPSQERLPSFSCQTGNCTWPRFTTLGVCHACEDVTSSIKRKAEPRSHGDRGPSHVLSLPGAKLHNLDSFDNPEYMVVNSTDVNMAIVLKNATWPPVVYHAIRAQLDALPTDQGVETIDNSTRFAGTECALSLCVMSIRASVISGIYTEEIVDRWMHVKEVKLRDSSGMYSFIQMQLRPPWGVEEGMVPGQVFTYETSATQASTAESMFTEDMLTGRVKMDSDGKLMFDSTTLMEQLFYANFTGTPCATPDDTLACTFRAIGASLTMGFRDSAKKRERVAGGSLVPATFVRIEWGWLTLPVALWMLSAAVVIAAMLSERRRVPLWKDNAVPLAFLCMGAGCGAVSERGVGGLTDLEMRALAETTRVRLVRGEGGVLRMEKESDS